MHHIVAFIIWYLDLLIEFAPYLIAAGALYGIYAFRKEIVAARTERKEAVSALARDFKISYAEADRLVFSDRTSRL